MDEGAASGADIEQSTRLALPDALDDVEAFRKCDLACVRLRYELFVGSCLVPLEHCIRPKTRVHILEPAAHTHDELVIQGLVAGTAERAGEISVVERLDVVLRGLEN